ncbi:MAG: hypothetical protein WCA27_06235 [Candidatus Sulfotelmatobacter sp.]
MANPRRHGVIRVSTMKIEHAKNHLAAMTAAAEVRDYGGHSATGYSSPGPLTQASRIFITRDDSGIRRLNTSYFLGVLSSVAAHNASRPYWMRSNAAPFNDFGSTIGNDARINLFHEFGPGIRQMVKGHAPRFVLRIEERISPDQHPRQVVFSSAR